MADSTVSALPAASALSGTELFYGVQSGGDVKVTSTQIQTFTGGSLTVGTSPIASGTTLRLLYDNAGVLGETSGVTFTGTGALTLSGSVTNAVGALNTPSYTFTGHTAKGLYVDASGLYVGTTANYSWLFSTTGILYGQFNGSSRGSINLQGGSGNDISLTAGGATSSINFTTNGLASFCVPANDTLQFGNADAAVAIAQTLTVQSVATGTGAIAGADWTRIASKGTDTAAGGNIIEKTGFSAKSGSSGAQHTTVDRKVIIAKGKVLTSAAAFSMFDVALPTLSMCGGQIDATIVSTDGTDMQSFTQTVTYSAVNKGGVYTTSITASTGDKSVSAGTLTTSWTVVSGANKVTIKVTPTTSLTPSANSFLLYYTLKNNSEQATTIL